MKDAIRYLKPLEQRSQSERARLLERILNLSNDFAVVQLEIEVLARHADEATLYWLRTLARKRQRQRHACLLDRDQIARVAIPEHGTVCEHCDLFIAPHRNEITALRREPGLTVRTLAQAPRMP